MPVVAALALEAQVIETTGQLAALIWDEANATGETPTEVARRMARDLMPRLAPELLEEVVVEGVAKLAHDAQHMQRRRGRPPIPWGAPHPTQWDRKLPYLCYSFCGADGRPKPLLEFTALDFRALRERALAIAAGWEEIAKTCAQAEETLTAHGCERVADLPMREKRRLNELAEKTFVRGGLR